MNVFTQVLGVCLLIGMVACQPNSPTAPEQPETTYARTTSAVRVTAWNPENDPPAVQTAIQTGLSWLMKAQAADGGWGAGLHAHQEIRDPHAVKTDPATTAMVASALIRTGNTLESGTYHRELNKAIHYVLEAIEASPENSAQITPQKGTQPQTKLGQNIDVSLSSQVLTQLLDNMDEEDQLRARIVAARDKCLRKIQSAQNSDGSIAGGTWAGVLQSAMATNALEDAADQQGLDEVVELKRAKKYQRSNVKATPSAGAPMVSTDKAAGVELYTLSSTTRATAKDVRKAEKMMEAARQEGRLDRDDREVNKENLMKAGVTEEEASELEEAYVVNQAARKRLQNEDVLAGFGNNGGEEFLSYLMTSESLAITGGNDWAAWQQRMFKLLPKIQNPNGSWSGHHCITSPVFCTAAVLQILTVVPESETIESKG